MAIEVALTTTDLWTPPPAGKEPPPPADTDRFAVWLMRTRGDPYWNPDLPKTDQGMPAWQVEMVRLIDVYQRAKALEDARRAAIHHAKLMHRRLLGDGRGCVYLVDDAPERMAVQSPCRGLSYFLFPHPITNHRRSLDA